MRRLLLMFILGLMLSVSYGQPGESTVYHPFPDSNAVWCEDHFGVYGSCDFYEYYARFMKGDSVVGGLTYHVLYCTGYSYSILCINNSTFENSSPLLIRQDEAARKVYVSQNGVDKLLYDFNLSLGTIVPPSEICWPNYNYVSAIDSVFMGNEYRRRFWLSTVIDPSYNHNYVALIEGVGTTFGLITLLYPNFEGGASLSGFSDTVNYAQAPSYCSVDVDIAELPATLETKVFPNPADDNFSVRFIGNNKQKSRELKCYTLQGKEIMRSIIPAGQTSVAVDCGAWTAGMYILQITEDGVVVGSGKVVKR